MNVVFILLIALVPICLFWWVLDKLAGKYLSGNRYYLIYKKNIHVLLFGVLCIAGVFVYSSINSLGWRNDLNSAKIPGASPVRYVSEEKPVELVKKQDKWKSLSNRMESFESRQNKDIESNNK